MINLAYRALCLSLSFGLFMTWSLAGQSAESDDVYAIVKPESIIAAPLEEFSIFDLPFSRGRRYFAGGWNFYVQLEFNYRVPLVFLPRSTSVAWSSAIHVPYGARIERMVETPILCQRIRDLIPERDRSKDWSLDGVSIRYYEGYEKQDYEYRFLYEPLLRSETIELSPPDIPERLRVGLVFVRGDDPILQTCPRR